MHNSHILLRADQVAHLSELTTRGTIAVKTYRRATALLARHEGHRYSAVAATLGVRYATVSDWAERFRATGLALLTDSLCSNLPPAPPQVMKIRLVQDNCNTHALSTFYDCLPAAMAPRLADRLEVWYRPKCGSWLNQIELDFSALSRQCLKRRILPSSTRLPGLLLAPTPGRPSTSSTRGLKR